MSGRGTPALEALRVAGVAHAVHEYEAPRATGYVIGGISPFGTRRRLPTVLDASAQALPTIHVSGGRRGLQLEVAPADLARLTGARTARIARAT